MATNAVAPELQALERVAELMCLAARTAPKARGLDNLYIAIIRGDEKARVVARMGQIAAENDLAFFERDARACEAVPLVVLLGTKAGPVGVPHCGYCGYPDCQACGAAGGLCAYNAGDLGIAIGSAAAVAATHHADNRVLFTFGKAAIEIGLAPQDIQIAFGLPLSATGKNPFFDRR